MGAGLEVRRHRPRSETAGEYLHLLQQSQLLLLLQAVLESHPGPRASSTQLKIFRSLQNLLKLLPRKRRAEIVKALRPLASHLLFPQDILPSENSGSWENVKAVLSKEITLPSLSDLKLRNDTGSHPKIRLAATPEELENMSLLEKLRQDVSMKSIKSVLRHDLTSPGNNIATLQEDVGDHSEDEDQAVRSIPPSDSFLPDAED